MAEQEVVAAEPNGGPVPTQDNAEANTKPVEAGDPQANANEGDPETEEQRRKSGYQRQKEARLRAEAEARYYRELLAQQNAPKQPEPKPEVEAKPKQEDFNTLAEYLDARDEWAMKQARKLAADEYDTRQKQAAEREVQQKQQQTWQQQVAEVSAEHEDFDEVVTDPTLPITKEMAAVIQKSPVGAKLAYYLGTHRDEAAEIAKLTDAMDVAVAMGEVKARIAQEKSEPAKEATPEPVVSKAPPPPTPVRKAAAANVPDIHDPKLPYKQFVKLREEQVAKKGK